MTNNTLEEIFRGNGLSVLYFLNNSGQIVDAASSRVLMFALIFFSFAGFSDSLFAQNEGYSFEFQKYGEYFRNSASGTLNELGIKTEKGVCTDCGIETSYGMEKCLRCRTYNLSVRFHHAFDAGIQKSDEILQEMRNSKSLDEVIDRLISMKKNIKSRTDEQKRANDIRHIIREIGKTNIGSGTETLNDCARNTIKTWLPALEGSDYCNDPAMAISYFLLLDGKGFLEKVKFIRTQEGDCLTLLEAYQKYSGTDPETAKELLEIIEDIQQLSSPEISEEKMIFLLDAIGRSLKILKLKKRSE
ncbi:MAG: hypothetical protein HQM10_15380 [Candidatus Riflebacteria bacterium]|nr:hypothetical protein [Candidatus Riflebacteria bacterium]